jgi:hypothetical protein
LTPESPDRKIKGAFFFLRKKESRPVYNPYAKIELATAKKPKENLGLPFINVY